MSLPVLMQNSEGYGTYILMEKRQTEDGYGGYKDVYSDGLQFEGVLTLDDSIQAQRAEAEGVTGVYTLTYDKGLRLPWHTVFRKKGSTETYRVTSKDEQSTPSSSALALRNVRCEEWEIPSNG